MRRGASAYVRLAAPLTFRPTELTTGPWSPLLQHAGPGTALAAQCLAEVAQTDSVARLTGNLLRPVPVDATLRVAVAETYASRNVRHFDLTLTHVETDKTLARFTALIQKEANVTIVQPEAERVPLPRPVDQCEVIDFPPEVFAKGSQGYNHLVEMRQASGSFGQGKLGASAVWFRFRHQLIDSSPAISGMSRVAVAADSESEMTYYYHLQRFAVHYILLYFVLYSI